MPERGAALQAQGGTTEKPEQPTRVGFAANEPINLRGNMSIDVPAGRMREVRASLCRCGQTENEPFCDRAYSRTGWRSEASTRDNN
jgi:CDGSH-type Zn-finger protein